VKRTRISSRVRSRFETMPMAVAGQNQYNRFSRNVRGSSSEAERRTMFGCEGRDFRIADIAFQMSLHNDKREHSRLLRSSL
jgi:hypothetical protein